MNYTQKHRGSLRLLTVAVFSGLTAIIAAADPAVYTVFNGKKVPLAMAEDLVAIEYNRDLEGTANLAREKADAAELGADLVETKIGINQMIVRGNAKALKEKIAAKSSMSKSIKAIRPVFYYEGAKTPEAMVVIPDRLVVAFKKDIGLDARLEIEKKYGLTKYIDLMDNTHSYFTTTPSGEIPQLVARIVSENPGSVAWSEPVLDKFVKTMSSTALPAGDPVVDSVGKKGRDPFIDKQWHLWNNVQNTLRLLPGDPDDDIDAPRFWNPNTRLQGVRGDGRTRGYYGDKRNGGASVNVTVIDSGTDLAHEDWETNQADSNNPPGFARSVLDSSIGYDYVQSDPTPNATQFPHGTEVAGVIAAARNNGRGVVGVAPSAKIYTLRVFDNTGSAVSSDLFAQAVVDSVNHLSDVGNHSYGGIVTTSAEQSAFQFAYESGRFGLGQANFVASGNATTYMNYPSLFSSVFSVGGVDDQGQHVAYASYGGQLDFVGPTQQVSGVTRAGIVTTDISGASGAQTTDPLNALDPFGNYTDTFNGTSAATPVVAGIGALLLSEYPTLPVQYYQTGSVLGWQTNLLEVMALTADRPPDPQNYFPAFNNAASIVYERVIPESDPPTTETVVQVFGNPLGYRRGNLSIQDDETVRDEQYKVDGFSQYFGYGRPNPYNAVTQQAAPSPYRDYLAPDKHDPANTDYGEMFVAYRSDFKNDHDVLERKCRELLAGEDGDPADVDEEELVRCIRESYNDWQFSYVTVQLCEATTTDLPLPEMHYASPFDDLRSRSNDFEFGPSIPMSVTSVTPPGEENPVRYIDNNIFPYVIHQAIPIGTDDDVSEMWYNPRGRYLALGGVLKNEDDDLVSLASIGGGTYTITSRQDPNTGSLVLTPPHDLDPSSYDWGDTPLIFEITIKHDLGVTDGSDQENENVTTTQFDSITIQANGQTIGTILGSSHNEPIFPVTPREGNDTFDCGEASIFQGLEVGTWTNIDPTSGLPTGYVPVHERIPMQWRTYRFPIPSRSQTGRMRITISMSPNDSYLPEWDNTDFPAKQIIEIAPRDNRGFQIGEIKIWGVDPEADPNTTLDGKEISDPEGTRVADRGTLPAWSASANEVFYVRPDEPNPSVGVRTMVAYADGLARTHLSGDAPSISGRESVTLFRACTELNGKFGACTPARILSLDSDARTSKLMYVVDAPVGQPRLYILTDDGFDETAVFPYNAASTSPRLDAGAKEAVFSEKSNMILFTDGNTIYSAKRDGSFREFVIDGSVHKVTNFRDLSMDDSDEIVAYTATERDGTDNTFITVRGFNESGFEGFFKPMIAWDLTNERQGEFSPDGKRYIFMSDAGSIGGGARPAPGAPFRLYVADNAQDIVFFDAAPRVVEVSMPRDNRLLGQPNPANPVYASGAYPRFSPDGSKAALIGFISTDRTFGEVATLSLPPRVVPTDPESTKPPAATPSPTPTPFPTETPTSDDNVTRSAQYAFDTAGDGWFFSSVSFLRPPINSAASGSLALTANNDNSQTYGAFVSPAAALKMFPYDILGPDAADFAAGLPITPPLEERQGPLYLLRYYLRRTATPAGEAATVRLRVNSDNFEDYHLTVITSRGTLSRIPASNQATAVDMLFQPNPWMYSLTQTKQTYRLAFDLLNIYPDDNVNAGYILDRVDIFRIPQSQIEHLETFKQYSFGGADVNDWETFTYPAQFSEPTFSTTSGRLEMASPAPPNGAHGLWQNKPGTIIADTSAYTGAVFAVMTARAGAEETNPFKVPEMRFRIAEESFQASAMEGVIEVKDFGSGKLIPSQGKERIYRAYLKVADDVVSETRFHGAWDLLSFENLAANDVANHQDSNKKIYLDSLNFDLIRIPNYPAPEANP